MPTNIPVINPYKPLAIHIMLMTLINLSFVTKIGYLIFKNISKNLSPSNTNINNLFAETQNRLKDRRGIFDDFIGHIAWFKQNIVSEMATWSKIVVCFSLPLKSTTIPMRWKTAVTPASDFELIPATSNLYTLFVWLHIFQSVILWLIRLLTLLLFLPWADFYHRM